MGVGHPCPPVRNDIVTLRHLFCHLGISFSFSSQYELVSAGERLFALPETDFPELQYVKKELNILNKLYQLYNNVMDTVEAWMDTIWDKVNVEVMV